MMATQGWACSSLRFINLTDRFSSFLILPVFAYRAARLSIPLMVSGDMDTALARDNIAWSVCPAQ